MRRKGTPGVATAAAVDEEELEEDEVVVARVVVAVAAAQVVVSVVLRRGISERSVTWSRRRSPGDAGKPETRLTSWW